MIGGMSSVTSNLSQLYAQSGKDLASAMGRISAGKKFVQPSDNFSAFLRGSTLENDVSDYRNIKADVATAKQYTDVAQKIGNQVYQDLVKLEKLSGDYTAAAGNADLLASIGAEYDALKVSIGNAITNTKVNNTTIMAGAAAVTYATVRTDNGGGTYAMTIAGGTSPVAATISGLATGASAAAHVTSALNFLTQAQSMGKTLDNISMIADTVISSKNAALEEVTGINDAEELAKVTDLQVRQQATISMLAQANNSRAAIAQLFQ